MQNFHEDPHLGDLLPPDRLALLVSLLGRLAGEAVEVRGTPAPEAGEVEFNLEPVAWVRAATPARQAAAAELVGFLLYYVGKYRLAANMYRDSTEESFTELQRRNEALQASEERYRELSRRLQDQVTQQVGVIEQAQQQLYESARLRAIGQLAAGVAHEINNPVGFISSNLRVAADYLDEIARTPGAGALAGLLADFRSLVEESAAGAARIAAIVGDLKTFSNIDRAGFTRLSVNQLVEAACNLLQAEHGGLVTLERDFGELPLLSGEPARLSQALYNVLDNAVRAIAPGGRIQVATRVVDRQVQVAVRDDGCGIPAAVLPRIFDPFFSTRGVGGGIGLGLTVARDVLRAHEGEVRVDSDEGRGTCVTLCLPVA
jgi:signal transduction histidine kinase